jgi:hypothetical protein
MALYEIELRKVVGSEYRLTDVPFDVGDELKIGGRRWIVDHAGPPVSDRHATIRFVCVEFVEAPPSG